jgi:hypothetical protein
MRGELDTLTEPAYDSISPFWIDCPILPKPDAGPGTTANTFGIGDRGESWLPWRVLRGLGRSSTVAVPALVGRAPIIQGPLV